MHLNITENLIGEGVFGKVFEGKLFDRQKESGTDVAVKIAHVTNQVERPLLLHEACALSILKGHPSIPQVHAWGRSQFYEYLVLQKLGPTLHELFMSETRSPLSERNLAVLAYQMLDVVQHMHSKGIIHRDIKPDNFVLGPPDTELAGRLYLIDFGRSKPYRDSISGEHLPAERTTRRTACRNYASLYDHLHQTLSRRDDMIAVAYTITGLLVRPLPWEWVVEGDISDEDEFSEDESNEETTEEKTIDNKFVTYVAPEDRWTMLDVVNCKIRWSEGRVITEGYSAVFGDFFNYAFQLEYDADPDYDEWKARFRQAVPDLPDDMLYDFKDTDGEMVGENKSKVTEMPLPEGAPSITSLWSSWPRTPIPAAADDGWTPAEGMVWRGPHSLEREQTLGDELEMVRGSSIHILQETPMSDIPLLASGCPQERMLAFK